jgi:hypothetical protein
MSRISDLAGFTTALSTTQDLSVGVITATSFSGDLTGDVTGDVTGNTSGTAGGLSGTPNITVGAINASSGTVSGNLSIGGTLTYQDVTNMDVLGIGTFQQGIQVLANGLDVTGFSTFKTGVSVTGVVTATSFSGNITGDVTGDVTGTATTATNASTLLAGATGADLTLSGVATATRFGGFDSLVSTASSDKTTYLVTVASKTADHRYFGSGSSSGYFLDGKQSPIVKLTPGKTYFFDQSDSSNSSHPLRFYLESDKTNQYTDGITSGSISAGTAGAGTTIVVGDSTPAVLHYQCSSHGYMGNAVTNDTTVVNSNYDTRFGGFLKEGVGITAGKLSDNTNIDVADGNLFLFTTTETTTATPNIRYDGSTTLNSKMDVGEAVSITIVTTAAAAGYAATVNIDGATVGTNSGTLNWTGGSAPSDGGSSGVDIYAYTIMKTAASTYTVVATQTKTA